MRKLFDFNFRHSRRLCRSLEGIARMYYLLTSLEGAALGLLTGALAGLWISLDAVDLICFGGVFGLIAFFTGCFYALRNF